jgi:hypothetical protein
MSKTNTTETDILGKVFNNTALSWDAATSLYVALHTADPGESGSYASEANYTSYARVGVLRSGSGFTVSGNTVQNAGIVQFPQSTGGTNVITHVSVGTADSGGQMLYSGALNAPLTVTNLIQPQFAAGSLTITED